jgi:hypothetical protein
MDDDGDLDSSSDSSSDEDDSLGDSIQALKLSESCDQLIKLAANSLASRARHTSLEVLDYFMPILRNPDSAPELPISLQTRPAALMRTLRAALRNARGDDNDPKYTFDENMRNILHRWHDRCLNKSMSTKSMSARTVLIYVFTVCKLDFHLAGTDREPYYYTQLRGMINAMDRFIISKDIVDTGTFELMKFMKMERFMKFERQLAGDAFKAYAAIALFYKTRAFAVSKYNKFTYNKLYRNEFRAIYPPDRRTHRSCTNMPKEFWKDFAKLEEDNAKAKPHITEYVYPPEWSQGIRPIIVRLYKHGIIRPSYAEIVQGAVTAAREPNRPLDLYVDYTKMGFCPNTDPTARDRDYIVKMVKGFVVNHPSAKFSALRLWSSRYPNVRTACET